MTDMICHEVEVHLSGACFAQEFLNEKKNSKCLASSMMFDICNLFVFDRSDFFFFHCNTFGDLLASITSTQKNHLIYFLFVLLSL